jgi:uncharacterized protein
MGKAKPNQVKNTAMITGASSGIGYALAFELARKGCDLYLVSLPDEQLAKISGDLSRQFNITVNYFETNLANQENCKLIFEDVSERSIPVNILINNAGIGSSGLFESFPLGFYARQMSLNIDAVVFLTHLFLPMLLQSPKAYILNISSLGAYFPMPNKEVYIASKSFILSFTKSLSYRFKDSQLNISVLCPGPVNTNDRLIKANGSLSGLAKKTVMPANEVARIAVRGLFYGKKIIIPGRINKLLLAINRIMPATLRNFLIRKEMKKQANIGHELL